jgi:hypothetical protein
MRYARGVNRLDGALIKSCFHPDATRDRRVQGAGGVRRGPAGKPAQGPSVHLSFPRRLPDAIEGNRAAHEIYFVGYHRLRPRADGIEKAALFGGRYLAVNELKTAGRG